MLTSISIPILDHLELYILRLFINKDITKIFTLSKIQVFLLVFHFSAIFLSFKHCWETLFQTDLLYENMNFFLVEFIGVSLISKNHAGFKCATQ